MQLDLGLLYEYLENGHDLYIFMSQEQIDDFLVAAAATNGLIIWNGGRRVSSFGAPFPRAARAVYVHLLPAKRDSAEVEYWRHRVPVATDKFFRMFYGTLHSCEAGKAMQRKSPADRAGRWFSLDEIIAQDVGDALNEVEIDGLL